MKRLVLKRSNRENSKLRLALEDNAPMPIPANGQVLVRMLAAPISPSDYASWTQGTDLKKGDAYVTRAVGVEGSGIVVASGGGWMANQLLGRAVGVLCSTPPLTSPLTKDTTTGKRSSSSNTLQHQQQGTLSEYVCVPVMTSIFPLNPKVDPYDAASFFVNPVTALAILDTLQTFHHSRALINTGAASQLGQMLQKLAFLRGITLINVVQRQENAMSFKAKFPTKPVIVVVASQSEDENKNNEKKDAWQKQLSKLIAQHNISVAFDCIAGSMTGTILSLLPNGGTCYVYGALSNDLASHIHLMDLIYRRKQIKGFHCVRDWLLAKSSWWKPPFSRIRWVTRELNRGLMICDGDCGWAMTSSHFIDCQLEQIPRETTMSLLKQQPPHQQHQEGQPQHKAGLQQRRRSVGKKKLRVCIVPR